MTNNVTYINALALMRYLRILILNRNVNYIKSLTNIRMKRESLIVSNVPEMLVNVNRPRSLWTSRRLSTASRISLHRLLTSGERRLLQLYSNERGTVKSSRLSKVARRAT